MKKFKKFLEEVTIKGNSGIPGENPNTNPKYLNDVERRANQRLGLRGNEFPGALRQLGGEIMDLLTRSQQLVRGHETELEQLAETVIRNNYSGILHEVELDIKIVRPGQVKQFMDEETEDDEFPQFRQVKDPDTIKEIEKAKISNNIIQGEAKNTKQMLHLPEVKEGLADIFGERVSNQLFTIWVRMTQIADKMDWIIPIDIKAGMMEEQPEGMAGAVKVDWKPKEKKDDDDEEDDKEEKKYSLEDDINGEEEEENTENFGQVIRARGVDFPMLLHETVKGIYELIAANGIPDDENVARTVKMNTSSFADEAEDFRYGPEIAADLRDFINKSPNIDRYPNLREFVFGKMVDRNYMSTNDFLILMKGILLGTSEARRKIDQILNEVVSELDKWESDEVLGHEGSEDRYKDDEEDGGSATLEPGKGGEEDDDIAKTI